MHSLKGFGYRDCQGFCREFDPSVSMNEIIVISSIAKYDLEATRTGMETIRNKMGEIYEPRDKSKKLTEEEGDKIADRVFNHITRAGETAVFKFDEDSAVAILGTVAAICKAAVKNGFSATAGKSVLLFEDVGRRALLAGLFITIV